MKVITSARFDPASVTADENGVCLMVGKEGEEPKELRAEQLLVAAGRALNTDNVGLETTRAKVEKGVVQVDGRMRTAEPHLYAIGDIIGGLLLAHVAAHEGITAVSNICRRRDRGRRLQQDAARDLFAAADRVDRPDAGRVRARRHPRQDRQGAVPGRSARRSSAATTRASQGHRRTRRPTRSWACT